MLTGLILLLFSIPMDTAESNTAWAEHAFGESAGLQTAPSAGIEPGFPFSFLYGGKPSSDFLPAWKREIKAEKDGTGQDRRILRFTDPETALEVRAEAVLYHDTPAADWTLYFTNRGTADSPVIEQVHAVEESLRPGADNPVVLHRLKGGLAAADDWLPFDQPLPPGKRIDFAATNGRSSNVCPFFTLDWGGGGVITGIGWPGQWAASVAHDKGMVRLQAGLPTLHCRLKPGESIRGPRILQLYWTGNSVQAAYNLWRRVMFAHIMPRVNGELVVPPIAHLSTSFYELNSSTEQNVLSHLEPLKGLGFEIFWLDAYWTRDGFPNGMGHYGFPLSRVEPKDRFPNGLRPISAAVQKEGMGFLLWFEPERVAANTLIAQEHPEWVLSPAKDGAGLFNLGLPEARRYMTDYLKAVVREYGLLWLRFDYNIDPLPFWQFGDTEPERAGLTEIRYVEGLYQLWDELRAAYPSLRIDNCASGGRRMDLETCSRATPLWRTDGTIDPLMRHDFNQAALQNQVMTAGLSRYVPFSTSGQMGANPYCFRSGFNAGISFCEDCRPADYPREQLKQAIEEGKRLRPYFFGNFYTLTEVTASAKDWCVLQYHRPEQHDGLILAFRRQDSALASFDAVLHEIAPEESYEIIRSPEYTPLPPESLGGEQLQHLRITIEECPGSMVIEYRRP